MIAYRTGGCNQFLGLFKLRGSVFPTACLVATPVSIVAFFIKSYEVAFFLSPEGGAFLTDNSVWSGFTVLVGFLIIFRTSEAYSRYWQGATSSYLMRAEWFDACSSLVAFCRHSEDACSKQVAAFQELLIRLFSVLHTCALAELEADESLDLHKITAYHFECIDILGLDERSVRALQQSPNKVELVFTWIQMLIVDAVKSGVLTVPPPLLTRSFQELANGMVQFHDALKIRMIPFPFPYAQLCDGMLILHGLLTPIVVSQWVTSPLACLIFSFVTVSTLWSLNGIAVEIQNPFGHDDNDLDGDILQMDMNNVLSLLVHDSTSFAPTLRSTVVPIRDWAGHDGEARCLWDAWEQLGGCPRQSVRAEPHTSRVDVSRQQPRCPYHEAKKELTAFDKRVPPQGEIHVSMDSFCEEGGEEGLPEANGKQNFFSEGSPEYLVDPPDNLADDEDVDSIFKAPTEEPSRLPLNRGRQSPKGCTATPTTLADQDRQMSLKYRAVSDKLRATSISLSADDPSCQLGDHRSGSERPNGHRASGELHFANQRT